MPNCEPQSPRWLSRTTRCPSAAMIRARLSPMTVERRCPTCIGLATLGDEKSMTTVLARAGGLQAERLVGQQVAQRRGDPARRSRRRLRNPGPATSGGPAIGARSTGVGQLRGQIARLAARAPWPAPCSRWPDSRRTWDRSPGAPPSRRPPGRRPRARRRRTIRASRASTFMIPDSRFQIPDTDPDPRPDDADSRRDYRRQIRAAGLRIPTVRLSAAARSVEVRASPQISSSA